MSVISSKNSRLVRAPPATKQTPSFTEERRSLGLESLLMTTRFLSGREELKILAVVEPIKTNTIKRLNKKKAWEYGYNKEHNVIVISKTGQIGEIYNIQNLQIALPKIPKKAYKFKKDTWEVTPYPKELNRIKTIFDWRQYPQDFKNKYVGYIEDEFNRRDEGFWFYNKGIPTYITGTHYMYLQWSKIDVGHPDFREANRLFYIYWHQLN